MLQTIEFRLNGAKIETKLKFYSSQLLINILIMIQFIHSHNK